MKENNRIQLGDSLQETIIKMAEGNPGALTCLMNMLGKSDWMLPHASAINYILMLDTIGLYGSRLYMLWNDCCDRDLVKMEQVLLNWQKGYLPRQDILDNLSKGRGTPFENLQPIEYSATGW